MKKEDLLSDDFLKQFKTGEDLYSFLGQLQKRGLEKMLEKTTIPNARNGFMKMIKKIKKIVLCTRFFISIKY